MKKLRQKYRTDCFPTCIAMIASISRTKARKLVHPTRKHSDGYLTTLIEGIYALSKLGYACRAWNEPRPLSSINNLAVIRFTYPHIKDKSIGHMVVWDPVEKRIYDPAGWRKKSAPHWYYENNMTHYLEVYEKI